MKKNSKSWVIPDDKMSGISTLVNGEEFTPSQVGAYYASSLEYNLVCTPQYVNAGDLAAPMYSEVRKVFKPKRPYGTFGALVSDEDQDQYQFEFDRALIELKNVDEIEAVANSLDSGIVVKGISDLGLEYTLTDGSKVSYEQAVVMQSSYKSHNDQIQKQIDQLVRESGYAPTFENGKKVMHKYPDYLLDSISALAKKKKSVTGFNLKIQVVGKHTIATNNNYAKSSISPDEILALVKKCHYKKKETFVQGTVRVGTVVVPIQTLDQLRKVKRYLEKMEGSYKTTWPEDVVKSYIALSRVSRE